MEMRSEGPTGEARVDTLLTSSENVVLPSDVSVTLSFALAGSNAPVMGCSCSARVVGLDLRFEIGQPAREYLLEQRLAARELRSAQNQRAACKAAERSFSNTPQSVPPRVRLHACARKFLHNLALFA